MFAQQDEALSNYKSVYVAVIFGTYAALAIISMLILIGLYVGHTYALGRLFICALAFTYTLVTHLLLKRGHYKGTGYLLVAFYILFASVTIYEWGINTPISLLIFGIDIVLAGIVLSEKATLVVAAISGSFILGLQTIITLGYYKPDLTWGSGAVSTFGDAIAYCAALGVLALIAWLYNKQIKSSLLRAKEAETALRGQKANLKVLVKKRTAELQRTQLEKINQMYSFAELGQLGVTVLHDLANHLTSLTLEIEGLHGKEHAETIDRAQKIIKYLDEIVTTTRERLDGKVQVKTFNTIGKITEVVRFLQSKADATEIRIDWKPQATPVELKGDPTSFCHVLNILIDNAIGSYNNKQPNDQASNRKVAIKLDQVKDAIIIKVIDWGRGVPKAKRKQLFTPFESSKEMGMGLGLFIAKRTIETRFGGSIWLDPTTERTEFVIKIPTQNE